jgi:hypothetical protein
MTDYEKARAIEDFIRRGCAEYLDRAIAGDMMSVDEIKKILEEAFKGRGNDNRQLMYDRMGRPIDLTKEIDELLRRNAQIAAQMGAMLDPLKVLYALDISISYLPITAANLLYWFYNQVKAGGPWDYKSYDSWVAAGLPASVFPHSDGYFDEGDIEYEFIYHGRRMSFADLGNYNYGIVGAAAGIPSDVLLVLAGAANLGKIEDKFILLMIVEALNYGPEGSYGDEKDDFLYILEGISDSVKFLQ